MHSVTSIKDFTRYSHVYMLRSKVETFQIFRLFMDKVEYHWVISKPKVVEWEESMAIVHRMV